MTDPLQIPDRAQKVLRAAPGGLVPVRTLVRMGFHRQEVAAWAQGGLCDHPAHGVYGALEHDPAQRRLHLPQTYLDLRRPPEHGPSLLTGVAGLTAHDVPDLPDLTPTVLVDRRCTARVPGLPFTTRRTDLSRVGADRAHKLRVRCAAEAVADAVVEDGVTPLHVRVAVDDLRNRGVFTLPDAVRTWSTMRGRGARTLMRWVDEGVFEQESEGERDAFRLLLAHDPPLADCQVEMVGPLRVDFVYLDAGYIIEYHGDPHNGTADADATRTDVFEQRGLRVKVVTKSMLRDAPRVRAQIQHVRQDRAHRVRTGQLILPPLQPQPERVYPLRTLPR